ncbi:MAG: hypothetical protein RL186_1900, partial [Pseudomonadota bacterium]
LTQKPDAIFVGLPNRVKARAARSLALTRLLKPALCSEQRAVCRGLSRMAKPPRSGATQWHPLQTTTDTQQSMQHFGKGTAVTKVRVWTPPFPQVFFQFECSAIVSWVLPCVRLLMQPSQGCEPRWCLRSGSYRPSELLCPSTLPECPDRVP